MIRFRTRRQQAKDATPPVTVAISTYNRRDSLERTLDAIAELEYPRFEVVVVNGPSTDGTSEVLARYADRARLADCPLASVGASRNIALSMAAGDIVAFTDDDGVPPPDWLSSLVGAFVDPDVGAVGGPVFDVPLDRIEWKLCTCNRLGEPLTDSEGPIDRYLGRGADPFVYLAGCNMAVRRSAAAAIGGFNPLLTNLYDDTDLCRRLIDAGHRIEYLENVVVRHHRAASAIRDGRQELRDPYPVIHGRAVFSLQCDPSRHTPDEISAAMLSWAVDWESLADERFRQGGLTAAERDRFVERAHAGAHDGILAGRTPALSVQIPDPPRDLFRRYR